MKAVALPPCLPPGDPRSPIDSSGISLSDIELPTPTPTGRDLLVRVEAVSVNPVDTKLRAAAKAESTPKVLGYDAAGTVAAVGDAVTRFRPGDAVYYAGDVSRPGSNAEYQLVDERIVGTMPQTLSFAEAAALPLTTITAWEALFTRLGISRAGGNRGQSLLLIGGAGGVGSIAIQLAKLAGLVVIATASRPQSQAWVKQLGADHAVDHSDALIEAMAQLGHRQVDYIANFSSTDAYWGVMAELIRPQGKIVGLVSSGEPLDLNLLKNKSATFAWEFMFTRAMYQTPDMADQGHLLDEVAALVDAGKLRTTLQQTLSPINAANLTQAHAQLESGRTIGKLVLAGWG
jgi:zinc-binding alcohol dehydrogenase family protein